jgi:Bacterial Ig-like domain (group 3)/FG-GAP-like repeat/FG-GAP repeat
MREDAAHEWGPGNAILRTHLLRDRSKVQISIRSKLSSSFHCALQISCYVWCALDFCILIIKSSCTRQSGGQNCEAHMLACSTTSLVRLLSSYIPRFSFFAAFAFLIAAACRPVFAQPTTTTTLTITSGGSTITSVSAGTVVTLTATVVSGSTPVTPGQVKFCNATAAHCEDSALLATAQLTAAGKATYKFRPGIGNHSYQAVFVGTRSYAKSSSAAAALSVPGPYPTATTLVSQGSNGNYALTATVVGSGSVPLTGSVSFLDTTNSNALLGSVSLLASGFNFAVTSASVPGNEPLYVAVGDFNGDGIPDLVTANQANTTATVMLGNGDGTFTFKSSLTVGNGPSFIAVYDFNGDGIPDLAVASSEDANVTVLLGNGDGTFTTKSTLSVGNDAECIGVGDFNGDGIPDLAVASEASSTVTILLGNGDGTFTTNSTLNISGGPASIAVGDFNGDGILDLAVGNYLGSSVTVLLGNGDGSFTTKSTINLSSVNRFIVVGDFNNDGILDLAATEVDSGAVAVLLGNGDGTFTLKSTPLVGGAVSAIILGDFNGDGITDLAVANFDSCATDVILGNGDGTFGPPASIGTGCYSYTVNAADFNGDGFPDLVVGLQTYGQSNPAAVMVLLNQPSVATASLSNGAIPGAGAHQILASYSGDTNYHSSTSNTVSLSGGKATTALNLGSSANPSLLGSQITLTATLSPYSAENFSTNGETVTFYNGGTSIGTGTLSSGVATLNISTLPVGIDKLTASYPGDTNFAGSTSSALSQTVSANAAIGSTTTSLTVTSAGSGVTSVAAGTVVTLTATVMAGSTPVTPGQVKFCDAMAKYCEDFHIIGTAQLTSTGTATLKFRPPIGSHSYNAVFVGTKTNAKSSSAASPLSVNGTRPTYSTISWSGSPANPTLSSTVMDSSNGQGPTGTVSFLGTSNSNAVLGTAALGTTASNVSLHSTSQVGDFSPNQSTIAVADFNNDGIPDVAYTRTDGNLGIVLGNGDGTFTQPTYMQLGQPAEVTAGDFNSDGNVDLAVVTGSFSAVTILLGNGDGTFTKGSTISLPAADSMRSAPVVADLNNDGIPDLAFLVTNTVDGYSSPEILVSLGNGDGTFGAVTDTGWGYDATTNYFTAADMNGDGFIDLVYGSNGISVLQNTGNGITFYDTYPLGTNSAEVEAFAIADFNDDGIPDIAVSSVAGADGQNIILATSIFSGTGGGISHQLPLSIWDRSRGTTSAQEILTAMESRTWR